MLCEAQPVPDRSFSRSALGASHASRHMLTRGTVLPSKTAQHVSSQHVIMLRQVVALGRVGITYPPVH